MLLDIDGGWSADPDPRMFWGPLGYYERGSIGGTDPSAYRIGSATRFWVVDADVIAASPDSHEVTLLRRAVPDGLTYRLDAGSEAGVDRVRLLLRLYPFHWGWAAEWKAIWSFGDSPAGLLHRQGERSPSSEQWRLIRAATRRRIAHAQRQRIEADEVGFTVDGPAGSVRILWRAVRALHVDRLVGAEPHPRRVEVSFIGGASTMDTTEILDATPGFERFVEVAARVLNTPRLEVALRDPVGSGIPIGIQE